MKKRLYLSICLWMITVMTAGCSLFGGSADESGQPETAADSPTPSVLEVLQKAEESMGTIRGFRYELSGDQNLLLTKDGKTETASMDFNASLHLAREPFGIHLTGQMNTDTDTMPIETYLSEGKWYRRIGEGDWMRTNGPSFGNGQGQTLLPTESLRQLRMLEQSDSGEGIQMTLEEEAYVLEINLTEEGLKKRLGDDYDKWRKALEPDWQEIGLPVADRDARLNQVSRRITVDQETGIPTQIDHVTVWEIPLQKGSVRLEQNMILSYTGESTEAVVIPKEVKESARSR